MRAGNLDRVLIASRCAWTTYNFRRQLIERLQQEGVEVMACGAGGDGYEERLKAVGISFVALPLGRGSKNLFADLRYLMACYRLIRKWRPQVLHAFTVKPVIFCSIAAALAQVPVRVAMITGLGYSFTSSGAFLRWLITLLYRLALRRVHAVYFQNKEDRDEFLGRQIVRQDQCRMIAGSGVDTEMFAPVARTPAAHETVFVMVARALREKGVVEFFDAARQVREQVTGARFILVGGVDERNPTSLRESDVKAAVSEAGVDWAGQVGDVRPFVANADIVVLPSYREGTPMSLLEAAAMAKPMIATDVPGCTEIVRDGITGWLVPPKDSRALANAMRRAMGERDHWSAYGKNARTLATSRFDSRIICRQIMDDYRGLVARSTS